MKETIIELLRTFGLCVMFGIAFIGFFITLMSTKLNVFLGGFIAILYTCQVYMTCQEKEIELDAAVFALVGVTAGFVLALTKKDDKAKK